MNTKNRRNPIDFSIINADGEPFERVHVEGSPDDLYRMGMLGLMGVPVSNQIEAQERRGQAQLVKAQQLPHTISHTDRAILENLGFVFHGPTPGDELFLDVTFPEGWSKRATDHAMYSDLIDPQGRKRGVIGYKAAFYDRWVSFYLTRRYSSGKEPVGGWEVARNEDGIYEAGLIGYVDDTATGERLFQTDPVPDSNIKAWVENGREGQFPGDILDQQTSELASTWLIDNFPDSDDPGAYWD